MKKLISVFACLCLLVSMTVCAVSAGSATIDFTDKANRVSYSTEQQVWAQNGITVTNDKAGSSSNVGDYGGEGYPVRFYKTSAVTVACAGMSTIVFNCDDYKDTYAADLAASITDGTVTVDGTVVTVTFDAPVDSLFIPELAAQVRVLNIVVNPGEGGDEPIGPPAGDDPAPTDTWEVATSLEAGVTYKLGLNQTAKGAVYYFVGTMSTYYGATETDVALAVDMFVEIVEGGYKLYFNDASGAKQYIKLVQSGTHYNFTFGAEGSVFTLDTERNALCAQAGDQICYMGTYGNYVTVGTLTTEKLKDTDYIARLYAKVKDTTGSEGGNTGSEGGNTGSEGGNTGAEGGNTGSEGGNTNNGGNANSDNNTDVAGKTDPMGESNVAIVLALAVMALACAGIAISKKRA